MPNAYQITNLAINGLVAGMEGKSEFLGTVSKRFAKGFVKKDINVGETIDVVLPPRPNPWITGRVILPQATEYEKVSVTVTSRNTSRVISDQELTVSAKEFFEDVVKPDVNGGVREAEIQALLSAMTQGSMCNIDSIGQDPANSRVWTDTHAKARMMLIPSTGVYGATTPLAMAALADNESKLFGPRKTVDVAALDGRVRELAGIADLYETVNLPNQTNGDGAVTCDVDGANQTGSTLLVDGVASGSTYKAGQQFWFSDATYGFALDPEKHFALPFKQVFTLTADAAISGNAATLSIAPAIIITGSLQNLASSPADGAAITFAGVASGVYPQSLLYDKTAFDFVGLGLPVLEGRGGIVKEKDYMGLPMRSVFFTDFKEGQNYLRYDHYTGLCNVRWQHIWRMWGAQSNA